MESRNSPSERLRIVVLGYFVRWPVGGMAWHYLHYVVGLARMGHDVYFVEDSEDYPSCWNPRRQEMTCDPSYGIRFTDGAFRRAGVDGRWAYFDGHRDEWLGPAGSQMPELCASADLVLNVSGVNPLRPWLMEVPVRVLIDTDPCYTQIKHLTDPARRELAGMHTDFATFGENYGLEGASIPADGFPWYPTRQPVVLDLWPVTEGPAQGEYRTVMQWDSYASPDYDGRRYGMKSESFRDYLKLPGDTTERLGIAASRLQAQTRQELLQAGWSLHSPEGLSEDPWSYQEFIRESKGEFTVAKQGYVSSRCGWFSERSASFLASGRPVVTQDTGFRNWLEAGAGLWAFSSRDEARAGLEEISARYAFHCGRARELAEQYFDARRVLPALMERAMNPCSPPEDRTSRIC